MTKREEIVSIAKTYVGIKEGSAEHKAIVDEYNSIVPLPRGYKLTYTDSWCAAFVSVVMKRAGITDFPFECGVSEMLSKAGAEGLVIGKVQPKIGDCIVYTYSHVGIVSSVNGVNIQTIEGNASDSVMEISRKWTDNNVRTFFTPFKDVEEPDIPTVRTWIKGNRYLNQAQMEINAANVVDWLDANDPGWTDNAKAALLANFEQESTINPGIWQSLKPVVSRGWGLGQWTPSTNYTSWARKNGYADDDGDAQMLWIRDMTIPFGQWITTSAYPISFENFKHSENDVVWLTMAWCKNWERGDVGDRLSYAPKWLAWVNGYVPDPDNPYPVDPNPPDPDDPDYPTPSQIRRKMPIYFYNLPWT